MITLDPVQLFALRKSTNEPIQVAGLNGAGKSTLANAIATQSARDGRSCLLIGRDASLDRPIAFQTLEQVHQVLANRAKLNNQTDVLSPKVWTKMALPSDLIEARAKTDPVAAKTAVRLLRRTRELTGQYKLNADEIEESIANQSIAPEAFDLASLCEHGSRAREGLLGVDEPALALERRQERGEAHSIGECRVRAEERELAGRVCSNKLLQHQPPEQPREHQHRQEEAGPRCDPAISTK